MKASQMVATIAPMGIGSVHPVLPFASIAKPFVTPLLQGKCGMGGLRSVPGGPVEGPLTVREVARVLRVSTATVYKSCASAELASVRVLNTIRVSFAEVARFGEFHDWKRE